MWLRLDEFLGHVGSTSLVEDVRAGEKELGNDDEEDEEAHSWRGGGYSYSFLKVIG